MKCYKFNKELYSKQALIKAAYNFTDKAFIHLDSDENYYYVTIELKENEEIKEQEFVNEILAQSVRHEIYLQTKNIREMMFARAISSSLVINDTETIDDNLKTEQFSIYRRFTSDEDPQKNVNKSFILMNYLV